MVLDAQLRLLLVHQPAQDRWSLPGGGIAFGEHPIDALKRELHEETGCQVDSAQLVGTHDNVYDAGDHIQRHGVRLLFLTTITGTPQPPEGSEIDRIGWYSPSQLPPNTTDWVCTAAAMVS